MKACTLSARFGPWIAAVCLLPSSVFAIGDEWRGDAKWEEQKPNGENGVPGFYMNLGPTGLRARLRDLSFEVKYVFADSPSAGKVLVGDVITGVNGRPFTTRHSFGFDWKVAQHGYEGPMMDFGNAIEESESKDGVLTLKVKRGDQELDVKLQLRPLGSFSSTFPYECKKSDQLFREICEDLAKTEKIWSGSWRHISTSAGLVLLASGDPKYLPICKRVAENAKQVNPTEAGGLNNWTLVYSGIYLSEYYLITHDASVLPALKKIHEGFVFAQVEPGSYQHQKNWGGYPELGIMVALVDTTWALMDKCGVEFDLEPYEMTRKRVRWLTRKDGAVIYARDSKPGWEKEPMVLDGGRGPYEDSGRGGAAMMGYYLSGHGDPKADEYVRKVGEFLTEYKEYFPDTHACPGVGMQWMGMGLACGYPEGFRKVMDYHKGYFNLMRGYAPGQYFALPCRSNACDLSFPRQFTSAVVGLILALKERKLQITGAPLNPCRLGGCVTEESVPGINPKALKGKTDTAYRALVKKNYGEAAAALKDAGPDDSDAAAILAYLEVRAQQSIALLEALEKAGDIVRLQAELAKAQKQFGLLPAFSEKVARFEEGLKQDAWKLELKLGANYRQMVDALRRNKTAAYVGDLERFGEKYPDSLYGKWAVEVVKEYRSSGAIKEPSIKVSLAATSNETAAPMTSAPASGTPAAEVATAAKETPAKPQAAAPKTAVSPDALAEWQARFVKKLDALAKGAAKLKVDLGDNQDYVLRGANEAALLVNTQGNDLPMPWRLLSPTYRAALSKGAATDDDVEALLIAAVMQLACNRKDQAEELFTKAALKDADAVKAARATLNK